jgi:hypothetical protein
MGLFWIVVVLFVMVALLRINSLMEDKSSGQKKSATPHDDAGWWYGNAEHITSDGGSDFDRGRI